MTSVIYLEKESAQTQNAHGGPLCVENPRSPRKRGVPCASEVFHPDDAPRHPASLVAWSPVCRHQEPRPSGLFRELINHEMPRRKEQRYLKSLVHHRWSMSVCLFLITDLAKVSLPKTEIWMTVLRI